MSEKGRIINIQATNIMHRNAISIELEPVCKKYSERWLRDAGSPVIFHYNRRRYHDT